MSFALRKGSLGVSPDREGAEAIQSRIAEVSPGLATRLDELGGWWYVLGPEGPPYALTYEEREP